MTRDDIKALIYDDPEVYAPPLEYKSALLEVTHGCSWRKCYFCDFRRDEYYHFTLEAIEQKLALLSHIIDGNNRLYFLGSNPFCLPTRKLMSIIDMVHQYLPSVEGISMYARADDINRKSKSEILALREAGVSDLHVGIESGSNEILKLHNKGETTDDMEKALFTLSECGIAYNLTAIPGLGGKQFSALHARKTAEFFSRLTPLTIWCIALKVWPSTPLEYMVKNGMFQPMNFLEVLKEERSMLEQMEMKQDCLYVDSSVLNEYTLSFHLPSEKAWALRNIDELIERAENSRPGSLTE